MAIGAKYVREAWTRHCVLSLALNVLIASIFNKHLREKIENALN